MNSKRILAVFIFICLVNYCSGQKVKPLKIKVAQNNLIKYSRHPPLVEPHLAVNPRNNKHMVISAIVYDSAATSENRTHLVVFATKDNGKTWKQTDLKMTVGFDPWVSIKDDKHVMLVGLVGFEYNHRNFLGYYTSSDGGLTWSDTAVNLGWGHDHPTLVTDHKKNRLYLLSNLVKRNVERQAINYAYLNYSDDWKTFQDSAKLFVCGPSNSNTLTVAVDENSGISAPYLEYNTLNNVANVPSIKLAYADSNLVFSGPFLITDQLGIRKGFPVFAIDTSGKYKGRRYVVKNTGTDMARSNGLYLHFSTGIGQSWSEEVRIDHNENKEKFIRTAAIAINKKGIIGIAWVDRRNDTALKKNDIYFSVSTDGGQTFSPEVRVTSVNSDPLTAVNGKAAERHFSGGDYMGCTAKPDGSFQLVWADNRSGIFQLYTSNITLR